MRGWLVAIVMLACAHAAPAPVPAPAPPPAPVPPPPPPPPPPTAFDDAMKSIVAFTDQMCRCNDVPCTQQVMNDITRWGTDWQQAHPEFKATDEQNKQIQGVAEKLMECMEHAGKGSAAPPP